jgi:hypothetical protein
MDGSTARRCPLAETKERMQLHRERQQKQQQAQAAHSSLWSQVEALNISGEQGAATVTGGAAAEVDNYYLHALELVTRVRP